jgi:hypothetical protein
MAASNLESQSNSSPDVNPKTLALIAAAVTEFLGNAVRIRSVRMLPEPKQVGRWARRGRAVVQGSHNLGQTGR